MTNNDFNASFNLTTFLKTLTTQPGIYQMLDREDKVLYIGKAVNLKNRVTSYFKSGDQSLKTQALLGHVSRIEVTVTTTENEALLLESNLIKKLKPRYNVVLRDDKSYPYLYLSPGCFPQLTFYRGKLRSDGQYFGPYPSAHSVRETLYLLQKVFRLRSCSDSFFQSRIRPCLQYQIKRCTAPCVKYISKEEYQKSVQHALLFLQGKNQQVIDHLILQMEKASDELAFEEAAHYRDQISRLRKIQEQQFVTQQAGNVDVIACVMSENVACVTVLILRLGRILGSKSYFPRIPNDAECVDVLTAFISQYYTNPVRHDQIPDQIIVNQELPEKIWLSHFLSEQHQKTVKLSHAVRGNRLEWLRMTINNGHVALKGHLSNQSSLYQRFEALQQCLGLDTLPQRLECFDISHTQGEATVASCVVFDRNGPLKKEYRRFNIKDITPGDDYAALYQALSRRYKKIKESGEVELPDIVFIDGGKGQLHQAQLVFDELQIKGVLLVGVAKAPGRKPGYEQLFVGDNKQGLRLPADSLALLLILSIRDEAHRFAIFGHRQQRGKKRHVSELEHIEGIGAVRRRELLRRFGGMQELKAASVREISRVPGISMELAKKIYATLHGA